MKPSRTAMLLLVSILAVAPAGYGLALAQPAQQPQPQAQSPGQMEAQALALARSPAPVPETGSYVGEAVVQASKDGPALTLSQGFTYVDPNQVRWDAPTGAVIDGSSIPAVAAQLFGSPLAPPLRDATAIHDVAARSRRRPWQEVHTAFYTALRTSGLEAVPAKILFAAVYHYGARWPRRDSWGTVPMNTANQVVRLAAARPLKGEKATIQVVPGPEAPILCAGCSVASTPVPVRMAEVVVRYVPLPPVLVNPQQFDRLRAEIESRNLTLEEIEDYRPPGAEVAPSTAPTPPN